MPQDDDDSFQGMSQALPPASISSTGINQLFHHRTKFNDSIHSPYWKSALSMLFVDTASFQRLRWVGGWWALRLLREWVCGCVGGGRRWLVGKWVGGWVGGRVVGIDAVGGESGWVSGW